MPRLFTGLEIPAGIATELTLLRGGVAGARWIEPSDFHLTLRFVGDVGNALANEIAFELEHVKSAPVRVSLERLATFGTDRPRSLIARAKESAALMALQAEHEAIMRRLGAPGDARKFVPHVTLARLKNVSAEAVAAFIESRGDMRPMSFDAARFVLYSSKGSTGGGPYRIEVAYPLDGVRRARG